jgi:hypothetical protein
MNKHLEIILKKMCEMVEADYSLIDFKEEGWFTKYTWTLEREKEFKVWLQNYLKDNKEVRQALLSYPILRKSNYSKAVDEFCFNYGWKYEKDKTI